VANSRANLLALLVAYHSGRTSIFPRRTFPVLRWTCTAADGWPLKCG